MTALSPTDVAILRRQTKRADGLEYLACRQGADTHQWERRRPDFTPELGQAAAWQCLRCLAIKRQVHTKRGEIMASDYEYPDGYLYRKTEADSTMEKMLTPMAVRAAYNKRITDSLGELSEIVPLHPQAE